ncbi:MAG: segregation/condensation protein A [Deltaproteobacteria bacterium]|jgi:segregation and condensation protein A|nr:segregation/condensation protein A [Deltaproteobacteria bacterium]MCL5880574.1 segregation/condensation protein A [Deltaproteobacteria bacterium]MDA8304915.1 segregation/condensation protein A [Deltaproteobacteria bacterium]
MSSQGKEPATPSTNVNLNNVSLQAYDGPLDLLLSLIKKNKINIYDIPIIEITSQYLNALGLNEEEASASLPSFNLDSSGDFIVMAAQLIYIKSLMLLPSYYDKEKNMAGEEDIDPRTELANMLIEYQKVKEVASFLDNRPILGRDVFEINIFRKDKPFEPEQEKSKEILFEANIFILSEYFYYKITEAKKRINTYEITKEHFSIKDKIIEIMERFSIVERIIFSGLMKEVTSKDELFTYFLAILEMSRLVLINLDQMQPFGEIYISPVAGSVLNYKPKIINIM